MKIAPKMAPEIDAVPPTIMPTKKKIDCCTPKLSGATNWMAMAPSEPAMPVNIALTAKARVLNRAMSMPIASAASGWSRMAIMPRPMRPRTRLAARMNRTAATASENR